MRAWLDSIIALRALTALPSALQLRARRCLRPYRDFNSINCYVCSGKNYWGYELSPEVYGLFTDAGEAEAFAAGKGISNPYDPDIWEGYAVAEMQYPLNYANDDG